MDIKGDDMEFPASIRSVKRSTGETLNFRDVQVAPVSANSREHLMEAAREALLDSLQTSITERMHVPLPSEPQDDDVLVAIPASASLTIYLSNAMFDKRIAPAELARLLDISRQEAHRMLSIRHQTKIDRVADALAAMGVALELAARSVRQIPVYKTADGTPTFRRYQLLTNGTTIANRKVRDVRPYSDETLMLVHNQGTGAQELMLVGNERKRAAIECCFDTD
jgi:antitoxin HicB